MYSSSRLQDTGRLQWTAVTQSRSLHHVASSKFAGNSGFTAVPTVPGVFKYETTTAYTTSHRAPLRGLITSFLVC